jgi:transmembrane sensor
VTGTPLPKAIAQAASDWILRREEGLSAVDEHALDAWRAADPRHEDALRRMEALWYDLDRCVETRPVAAAVTHPRRFVRWSQVPWAIAASLLLLWLGPGGHWFARLGADYVTEPGTVRTVALADGSQVVLDSDTAIAVHFTSRKRAVRLIGGRALFAVAADRDHPFVVEAANGSATALGTRFIVATDGTTASAVVTEHRIEVRSGNTSKRLGLGDAVDWQDGEVGRVRAVDIDGSQAWTRGKLVAAGMPLTDVLREVGRYRRGYVLALGEAKTIRVSGVFDLTRPDDAIEAVRKSLGLRETRLTDRLILLRR